MTASSAAPTAPPGLTRKKGALWAASSGPATTRQLSLPMAMGLATGLSLLLMATLGHLRVHPHDQATPEISQVELVPPAPVPETPPPIVKQATRPLAKPLPKAVPPAHAPRPDVPTPVAPAPKTEAPPTAPPATIPAAVQAKATAPAMATPTATGAPTAPSAAAAVPKPASTSNAIGVVCPVQVKPIMPRQAVEDGLSGTVRARALIQDGVVKEVTILSGPRVFHAAVKAAMLQYKCESRHEPVSAEQSIDFQTVD